MRIKSATALPDGRTTRQRKQTAVNRNRAMVLGRDYMRLCDVAIAADSPRHRITLEDAKAFTHAGSKLVMVIGPLLCGTSPKEGHALLERGKKILHELDRRTSLRRASDNQSAA